MRLEVSNSALNHQPILVFHSSPSHSYPCDHIVRHHPAFPISPVPQTGTFSQGEILLRVLFVHTLINSIAISGGEKREHR